MTQPVEETKEQIAKALNVIDGSETEQMIFRIDNDTFRFKDVEYKIIENHREAFDIEQMEHRFTDYLLKYDYIVGDIAYEKLRLRGFYEDHRKGVPIDMKISNLEDYLIEYCSFGCQYFVFERVEKKKEDPESYFKRSNKQNQRNKSNPRRRSNARNKGNNQKVANKSNNQQKEATNTSKKVQTKQKPKPKANPRTKNTQKEFQVVKKQEVKVESKPAKTRKTLTDKKKTPKKQFEIRKKTD